MSSDNVYQKYAYLTVQDITDGLFEKNSKFHVKDDSDATQNIEEKDT